jgi:hypothetical protein
MINYFLSALNIWAGWSIWVNSEDYKYFAIISFLLSLIVFLQQRDIEESNNFTEKEDE